MIEGNLGRVRTASEDEGGRPVAVPVMGRIAAGTPVEAIQTKSHVINMPADVLSTGEHFALEVRGDSMIEAGILDGDIALIKKTDGAETGDIVVALIDNEEATLSASAGGAPRLPSSPPIPPTSLLSPTACASKANWWGCSGGTDAG